MYRGLRTELQRIAVFTAFCTLIGWLLGDVAWCLIFGGALYSIFLLRQMQRFYIWLAHDPQSPPPQSSGIWGDIFDTLYRLRKTQAQEQAGLMDQVTRMEDSTAALREGVVLLDNRCSLEFWNEAAGRLLGLKRETDLHQIFTNLFRDPAFARYFHTGDYSEPLVLASPLAHQTWLEFQITVFGNNEKLMVIRDVTRLQQLEKIRSDFIANLSHELRTPLTVLKGYVETLHSQADSLPATFQTALEHMEQQTRRMQALIDDLTLLSRLENRNLESSQGPIAVHALAQRLARDAGQLSPDHTIELEGEVLILNGNEQELYSAFSNLVTNALRYSPTGSRITLKWGHDNQGAFFAVTDEGPGIAAVHLPRLTERFYRVDSGRGREQGGTGLGLAIVKHALARNQGHLLIQSSPGNGSTFTCRFPLQPAR